MQLNIKRGEAVFKIVEIDKKTVYVNKLMGEHKIKADFIVESPLNLQIGDHIEYNGEQYTINRLPGFLKDNEKTYHYKIDFDAEIYTLHKIYYRWDGLTDFSYTGNASDFLNLLLTNINVDYPGWTVAEVEATEEKTIDFNGEKCRTALTRIAEAFKLEYSVTGKAIALKKSIGQDTAFVFEYGRGKGLYRLERKQISDQNIVTRMYGFGGTKNIPSDYRGRAKRLVFNDRKLENNIALYGTIEGEYKNEDIFPKRTGVISGVSITFKDDQVSPPVRQEFYIEDSAIDFDINDQLLEGQTPMLSILTGDLAGYDLEITKYDHANKRIYFSAYSEEDGYTLPNDLNKPVVNDTYTLFNIKMPQSYVTQAEDDLQALTQESLNKQSIAQVVYESNIDPKYVKSVGVLLKSGDRVTTKDTALAIDALIRVSQIEYPLTSPNEIKATIADFIPYTIQERLIKTAVQAKKETVYVDKRATELARQGASDLNRLKGNIIDQDQYFKPENIRPQSIEALYMAIGAIASEFRLNGSFFQANYNGDKTSFNAASCDLTHLLVKIEGVGETWSISPAATLTALVDATTYYLYAKCSQSTLTGSWVLDSAILPSDGGDGFYYFAVGSLLPVDNDIRVFKTTYGRTYANGRELTTGIIQSINGLNFFDLDGNKFKIGDANSSLDWGVTSAGQLTLKGIIVQSPAGSSELPVFLGAYDPEVIYTKGNEVTDSGSTWRFINSTPTAGQTPSENAYWTIKAAKGTDGQDGQDGANGTSIALKGSVATSGDLPTSGNAIGDGYITTDNGHLWMWNGSSWDDIGQIKGDQGVAGVAGEDGTTYYTWIKYADDINGNGLTDDPTGKDFIGLAYNKTTANESTTKTDYTWALIKGDQGIQGETGANGLPTYTWIKYADDINGNGLTDDPTGKDFIGLAYNKTTQTESTNKADYIWSLYKGAKGDTGNTGATGATGAKGDRGVSLIHKGTWDASELYNNSSTLQDVIKESDVFYKYIGTDGQTALIPPNASWEAMNSFKNVATDILLAQRAVIADLIAKFVQTAPSGARIEVDGEQNQIAIFDDNNDLKTLISPKSVMPESNIGVTGVISTTYATREDTVTNGSLVVTAPEQVVISDSKTYTVFTPKVDYSLLVQANYEEYSWARVEVHLEETVSGQLVYVGAEEVELTGTIPGEKMMDNKAGSFAIKQISGILPGTYKMRITISRGGNGTGSAGADIDAGQIIKAEPLISYQEIAKDGFNFINSATDYVHNSVNLFKVRKGNTTFEVNTTGVKVNGTYI